MIYYKNTFLYPVLTDNKLYIFNRFSIENIF